MFFIIDIIPMRKLLKTLTGTCRSCNQQGQLQLIKTYQCLRFFFIPVFKWHTRYYVQHTCGGQMAITEEDAIAILHVGVHPDEVQMESVESMPKRCTECGKVLEESFICCPYCGKKLDK